MNYNVETEQRHYDSIYSQKRKDWPYDHLFRSADKTFNNQVIELINQRDFTKILDLGCGNGEKTKYLQFIDNYGYWSIYERRNCSINTFFSCPLGI